MYETKISSCWSDRVIMEERNNNVASTEEKGSREGSGQAFANIDIRNKIKEEGVKILVKLVASLIATAGLVFVSVKYIIPSQFSALNGRVDVVENNVSELSSEISEIKTTMEENNKNLLDELKTNKEDLEQSINYTKEDLKEKIDSTENTMQKQYEAFLQGFGVKLNVTSFSASKINCSTTDIEKGYNPGPSWEANRVVGTDTKTGKKYKAKNLINKKILVPYKENGQEIYFFGQYNADYHWDGNCIINVYSKDKLVLITNTIYEDGKLKSYRQVLKGKNNTWIISKRKVHKNYNSGESWSYRKRKEVIKNFSLKNVQVADIIGIEQFKENYAGELEGYYKGRTSDGKYNDKTGNAYMVKYFEGGVYVRTLYCGRFVEGEFEDKTEQSWYIVKDVNTDYMYYKGPFEGGTAKYKDDRHFEHLHSKREIETKLRKNNFSSNIILNWDT